jgi:CRISP-associated protein Cas1
MHVDGIKNKARILDIHRLRIVIRMTAATRLHLHHAAELYALLAHANGMASGIPSAMPDGLLLDAPERCRMSLAPGHEYAFGFTWLSGSPQEARGRIKRLIAALDEMGETRGLPGAVFGNNFRIAYAEDLIAGNRFDGAQPPASIPRDHIQAEIERLRGATRLTLCFTSPLRFRLPKPERGTRQAFADQDWFNPNKFVERADHRQVTLGIEHASPYVPANMILDRNDLVWLDVSYGPSQSRTTLGGVLGKVLLSSPSPSDIERLVWGQYVSVGDNTRFGFGKYRIAELGPDPFPCERAVSLTRLALKPAAIDDAAERYGAESGTCAELVRRLERGVYHSEPYQRVTIVSGSRSRELSIPAKPDRVLQRAVHQFLAPALDLLMEESSLAFRQGLGRRRAAERMRLAHREGFRWALRADIDDFFDTIDHAQLEVKIRSYLADERLADLIMDWVRTGAPFPDRGLPTGAVISPLLSNLFLDQFDERIASLGGRLVRYADDFVILFRSEAEARAAHQHAADAAGALKLKLNEGKTQLVDLDEPFSFLGFRFHRDSQWEATDQGPPRLVDDLGWHEAGSQRDEAGRTVTLAGETTQLVTGERATLILGPGLRWLGTRDHRLHYGYGEGGQPSGTIPFDRLEQIVAIGAPTIYEELLYEMSKHSLRISVLDDWCRPLAHVTGGTEEGNAELIMAQVAAVSDQHRRLQISRELVVAKLLNYATLADAMPGRKNDQETGQVLRARAADVGKAESMSELLGLEGSAAALWYGRFNERLPTEFSFERRIAPHAEDPVNILLNIAQTILHRLITSLLSSAGLNPNLGFLHLPRSGHASLASDLQEPFRHLMDRAVIDATRRVLPSDFVSTPDSRFRMKMRPAAAKRYLEQVHRVLAMGCIAAGDRDPAPYRIHIARTIRSLKRQLLRPEENFVTFHQSGNS